MTELTELTNAINSKTKDTAPGLDNVTYSMFRYLPQSVLKAILIIFNNTVFGIMKPLYHLVRNILKLYQF